MKKDAADRAARIASDPFLRSECEWLQKACNKPRRERTPAQRAAWAKYVQLMRKKGIPEWK